MEIGKIALTKVPAAFVEDTAVLLEWLGKIGAKRLPPEAYRLSEMIEEPMEEEPKKAGRPKIELDYDQIEKFGQSLPGGFGDEYGRRGFTRDGVTFIAPFNPD